MPRLASLAFIAAAVAAISPPIARSEPAATPIAAARKAPHEPAQAPRDNDLRIVSITGTGAPALSVREALSLATALRNLDGRPVVVRQGGQDVSVVVPWEFGSGSLRMRVAGNLAILAAVERGVDASRQAIIAEILKGTPGGEIKPGTPQFEEFQRQLEQVLAGPAHGARDLAHITVSELKLDRNEIAVTVLQALKPILDQ